MRNSCYTFTLIGGHFSILGRKRHGFLPLDLTEIPQRSARPGDFDESAIRVMGIDTMARGIMAVTGWWRPDLILQVIKSHQTSAQLLRLNVILNLLDHSYTLQPCLSETSALQIGVLCTVEEGLKRDQLCSSP